MQGDFACEAAAYYHGDVRNVMWMLGADTDIQALRRLLGDESVGGVTIAQALHWMNHRDLFRAVVPLLRPGGGIAVVTNGTPLWLQETDWSRALRDVLEDWLGITLTNACGTDAQSQRRYSADLAVAGFDVVTTAVDYVASLDIDQLVGAVTDAAACSQCPTSSPVREFPTSGSGLAALSAGEARTVHEVNCAIGGRGALGRRRRRCPRQPVRVGSGASGWVGGTRRYPTQATSISFLGCSPEPVV